MCSMIDTNLICIKPKEHYVALKRKTHYYLDSIYKNNYAPRHKIGSCSFLYKTLRPTSYQDFYEKYINYLPNVDAKYRGRSIEEISIMSKDFEDKAKNYFKDTEIIQNLTFEDFFDLLILHIIIETYDGHFAEEHYKNLYHKLGYEIIEPNDNDDALRGIDFIIKGKKNHQHFIQVKPRSFATSTSSTSYDRANHFHKEKLIKERYGNDSMLEFIFYEKDDIENNILTYMLNDNKIRFSLSDVSELNGDPKYPSKKDFQKQFKMVSM